MILITFLQYKCLICPAQEALTGQIKRERKLILIDLSDIKFTFSFW